MQVAYNKEEFTAFSASREQLEGIIVALSSDERAAQEHGEVEAFILEEGTELLRKLLQGYLDIRADTEIRQECQWPSVLIHFWSLILRHLRKIHWLQWKKPRTRFDKLLSFGVNRKKAARVAWGRNGPWFSAANSAMNVALNRTYFANLGWLGLVDLYNKFNINVNGTVRTVVWKPGLGD